MVCQLYLLGNLDGGDFSPAPVPQALLCNHRTFLWTDEGIYQLAVLFIRRAHHGHILHRLIIAYKIFYFPGAYILPAPYD